MKIVLDKYKFPCKNNPKCQPLNWWAWLQGKVRKTFYGTKFAWLIRKHIRQQIDWRLSVADKECKTKGACKMCGCEFPGLQMADKACPKPCYPKMMTKTKWTIYKLNYKLNYD